MGKRHNSISSKWWFQTIINTLIAAVIYWGFNAIKPSDPQVKAALLQIEQLKTATQKDALFIELAQELTGKKDTQTVERIKHDVLSYLAKAMNQYPTREEFVREKHRFIDKEQGIIWESKMENGNMVLYAVAPYTNSIHEIQTSSNNPTFPIK